MSGMTSKNTFSVVLRAIACIAFAMALVLFPPSASHAASGLHDDHHAVSAHSDDPHSSHMHEQSGPVSNTADNDQTSGQCCSSVCLSVDLVGYGPVFVDQATSDKYLTLHAQTRSIEPSGFLRPPQHLI
jgi:hypothetical protein